MATTYGSWVTVSGANMYRAVVETSQSGTNTQSTVTMTVKIQYGTSSAVARWAQFLTTSLTISSNLNGTTQSATATASPTPGGTQTLVTRTATVTKTHAAQSVATNATVGTVSGGGKPATSSTASGSVSVGAKTSYKVTYNANGGDSSSLPATQTKWYGETLTLSGTLPKRSGCTFFGWNTKADGTGTHYNRSASYTANAALTLYAMWLGLDVPSLTVKRTDAQGQESDEGAYGTLQASWTAVGTIASTVRVTARNVTAGSAITLSGNTSGTLTPGQTVNGSVSSTFGGNLDTDTRYLVRLYIEINTTSAYAGQTRTVSRYFDAYVDVAYITIDVLAGGHGVTFGNPASQEGFHCYMPTTFHDTVNFDGSFTETWQLGPNASSGSFFDLPAAGTYLLATAHNSSAALNGLWMLRTGGNTAFKLAGGSGVTVTVNGTRVGVSTTGGTANTYYQRLN